MHCKGSRSCSGRVFSYKAGNERDEYRADPAGLCCLPALPKRADLDRGSVPAAGCTGESPVFCILDGICRSASGVIWFVKERKRTLQKKRAGVMKKQFLDAIQMMASAMQAGYSAENAVKEALKELEKVYEQGEIIIQEFRLISAQLDMSRTLESLFLDFGKRSADEDIRSFAEVLQTARRSGGDLLAVIRNTVWCIRQKQETVQEIETSLSGKVMEQNIMSLIPLFILAYIKLTSPEFLEVMYQNATGTAVMAVCLAVYAGAYFWGRKIVRVEV